MGDMWRVTGQIPTRAPGFEDIYRESRHDMVRLAHVIVGSNAVAEEVVHDAFMKLHDRWSTVDNPHAYLWTSVVNGARKVLRRRALELRHREDAPHVLLPPEVDETWEVLRRLPERRRTALALRYYADLPVARIAELMGAREGTVRSLIHRGLESMRRELEQ